MAWLLPIGGDALQLHSTRHASRRCCFSRHGLVTLAPTSPQRCAGSPSLALDPVIGWGSSRAGHQLSLSCPRAAASAAANAGPVGHGFVAPGRVRCCRHTHSGAMWKHGSSGEARNIGCVNSSSKCTGCMNSSSSNSISSAVGGMSCQTAVGRNRLAGRRVLAASAAAAAGPNPDVVHDGADLASTSAAPAGVGGDFNGGDGGRDYWPAGLYGMTNDELLDLLWQSAGLQALQFAPALPHMAASQRYMQVSPHNLAAWVSLLADMEVRSPAAVLASCPAFLLVPLTEDEQQQQHAQGHREQPQQEQEHEVGYAAAAGSPPLAAAAVLSSCPADGGGPVRSGGPEYGGPAYGTACRRFVAHLRDELLMDERHVFGLLARLPSLALVPPARLDEALVYLSVVLKGAGPGHRLGPEAAAAASSSAQQQGQQGHGPPPPKPAPPPPPPLSEEAELDLALYRFLRRAPAVLAMTRADLSYTLERLSYDGGLDDYVGMCRLLCAVPELLPAAAARLQEARAAEAAHHATAAAAAVAAAGSEGAEGSRARSGSGVGSEAAGGRSGGPLAAGVAAAADGVGVGGGRVSFPGVADRRVDAREAVRREVEAARRAAAAATAAEAMVS
ncbi:hypothetical protein PLESTF_000670300 [Pleodorina starrii]|nr:hypothetical protein PLESTF_000670300 [Pleodorina starrii]